jgi:hypothetical protein
MRSTSSAFGAPQQRGGPSNASRGFGRIAGDDSVPLGQRGREDGFVECEVLSAKLCNFGNDLLPVHPAADDGVAAVDVSGHVFKSRLGEFFAKRLNRQLRFPADTAEEDEIDGAFHAEILSYQTT